MTRGGVFWGGLIPKYTLWSHVDKVRKVPSLIYKDMIKELINKMKDRKSAGPSGVVRELVKAAGEERFDTIT